MMGTRDWENWESMPTRGSTVDGLTKKKTRKKVNIIKESNKHTTRINKATVSISVLPTVPVDLTDAASYSPVDFFNSKQHLPSVTFYFSFLRSSCRNLSTWIVSSAFRSLEGETTTDRPTTTGIFYIHGSIPFQFLVIMVRM